MDGVGSLVDDKEYSISRSSSKEDDEEGEDAISSPPADSLNFCVSSGKLLNL
jgi:hypothetical protein